MAVEEAAVEEHPPPGGEKPIKDRPGKDQNVSRLDSIVVKLDELVFACIGAFVVLPAFHASHASSLDLYVIEAVNRHLSRKGFPQSFNHPHKIDLTFSGIMQDNNFFAIRGHRGIDGTRPILKVNGSNG